MDTEKIKKAKSVLEDERAKLLDTIATDIVNEKSANKKILTGTMEERMRETHRKKVVIDDICNDFIELLGKAIDKTIAEVKPKRSRIVKN